jgi:23S rRNA pseudouridine1911/1915/1917 synthase
MKTNKNGGGASAYAVPAGPRCRADKAMSRAFPEQSRTAWQRAFEAGLVFRAGKVLGQKEYVHEGDEITYSFPATVPSELTARDIPLEILFEDQHLLVINKASGMVVHPGAGTRDDTLVHALLAHCAGELSGVGGVERPGIVHRLDRETSGAMVVAKNDAAHRKLADQFAQRTVQKEYLALVSGVPPLLSGSIRKPIGRNPHQRHKMTAFEIGQGWNAESEGADADEPQAGGGKSREAHTDWVREEKFGLKAALLRCILHTGRTHQIRVHLKSIGHILLGDAIYGFKPHASLPDIPRVMLHAERLRFLHPVTGKTMDVHAPLPKDFVKVQKALRKLAPLARPVKALPGAKPVFVPAPQGYSKNPPARRLGRTSAAADT